MKRIYLNIIIACASIILLFFPAHLTNSCGYSWLDESKSEFNLFSPQMLQNKNLQSLSYDVHFSYYSGAEEKDEQRNCQEWQAQFSDSVSITDIKAILYKIETIKVLDAIGFGELTSIYKNNTFAKALSKPENAPLLDYFKYIYQLEFSREGKRDPWGLGLPTANQRHKKKTNQITHITVPQLDTTSRHFTFLKERMTYQKVIANRYDGEYSACIEAFEDLKNSNSILRAWAYIHVAHAYYRLNRLPESNYALAMSFNGCENKKDRAIQGFIHDQLDSTLMLTKNAEERAAILTLSAVQFPGPALDVIQTIIREQPDYPFLQLLIQREINKLDNWLIAPYLLSDKPLMEVDWDKPQEEEEWNEEDWNEEDWNKDDNPINYNIKNRFYTHKNYQKDLQHLRKLRAALLRLKSKKAAQSQSDFLNLAIAHLYYLDFKPNQAWQYINQVNPKKSLVLEKQVLVQRLLIIPQIKDITSRSVQTELYQSLDLLERLNAGEKILSILRLSLSRAFYQKGKNVEAGLLYAQTDGINKGNGGSYTSYYADIVFFDKYGSVQDVERTINFLEKQNKTPFEKYLCQTNKKKPKGFKKAFINRLRDVQGTIAFRQDKLNTAYNIFNKLPHNFWKTTYEFAHYLDTPIKDVKAPKGYYEANKAHIVERMLSLKKSNEIDSLLLLADIYKSCSSQGDAWMMFSYGKYPDEAKVNVKYNEYSYNFYPNSVKYKNEYYHASRAFYIYKRISQSRKATLEQKANALAMMGHLDRYGDLSKAKGRDKDDFISPYFWRLKKNYTKASNYSFLVSCSRHYELWKDL